MLPLMRILNNWILNITKCIYPPTCIVCSAFINNYNQICKDCIASFEFPKGFLCSNCCNNLDANNYKPEFGNTCIFCANNPPYFSKLACALSYNNAAAKLISTFKYKDKQELAKLFAELLTYSYIGSNFNEVDIIVPMPISYLKLLNRKYNQVALITKHLSKSIRVPYNADILYKRKHTKAQASLDLTKRLTNVKGSFALRSKKSALIKNKTILLIDDIVTTGSTINEASKMLKNAGAKRVYVLAIARVKGEFKIY